MIERGDEEIENQIKEGKNVKQREKVTGSHNTKKL